MGGPGVGGESNATSARGGGGGELWCEGGVGEGGGEGGGDGMLLPSPFDDEAYFVCIRIDVVPQCCDVRVGQALDTRSEHSRT